MKHFTKLAVMTICLLLTAIFTSACGGGSKANPPSYPYIPINNQANNNGNNNQQNNNQQENNNNQEENNNEEESAVTSEVNLTLTDSLQSDKIAFADIYYSVESTAKSSADDQEILKAEPNADDNTKFTVKVPDGIDVTKAKIKAVLTYDNEENLLDYFSSYDGVEATSGSFDVNFENSKDNEEGFGGGTGTEADPFIISAPRHLVNINKQDNQGNYLYMAKNFKQTADLDFTHLVGFKVNKADNDKEITGEVANKKAPFYNDGKGITKIGGDHDYNINPNDYANEEEFYEAMYKNCFKGTYDGDSHTIDGIIFVNPKITEISLFNDLYGGTIKNLTIGENSIVLIDENNEIYSENLYVGMLSISLTTSTVENCTNNAKIIIKNVESQDIAISGLFANSYYDVIFKNCTNNGNITIDKCKITDRGMGINGIGVYSDTCENCTNNGNITITNSNSTYTEITGLFLESKNITGCVNKGNIELSDNTIIGRENYDYPSFSVYGIERDFTIGTNCTNEGNITIKNNTTNRQITVHISGITEDIWESMTGFVNSGNITIDGNSNNYEITAKQLNIGDSGTISNCTENGTITINGVVQP